VRSAGGAQLNEKLREFAFFLHNARGGRYLDLTGQGQTIVEGARSLLYPVNGAIDTAVPTGKHAQLLWAGRRRRPTTRRLRATRIMP
jgi:hypothetical protein